MIASTSLACLLALLPIVCQAASIGTRAAPTLTHTNPAGYDHTAGASRDSLRVNYSSQLPRYVLDMREIHQKLRAHVEAHPDHLLQGSAANLAQGVPLYLTARNGWYYMQAPSGIGGAQRDPRAGIACRRWALFGRYRGDTRLRVVPCGRGTYNIVVAASDADSAATNSKKWKCDNSNLFSIEPAQSTTGFRIMRIVGGGKRRAPVFCEGQAAGVGPVWTAEAIPAVVEIGDLTVGQRAIATRDVTHLATQLACPKGLEVCAVDYDACMETKRDVKVTWSAESGLTLKLDQRFLLGTPVTTKGSPKWSWAQKSGDKTTTKQHFRLAPKDFKGLGGNVPVTLALHFADRISTYAYSAQLGFAGISRPVTFNGTFVLSQPTGFSGHATKV